MNGISHQVSGLNRWKIWIPKKINIFVWGLIKNRIAVKTILEKMGINHGSTLCEVFKAGEESIFMCIKIVFWIKRCGLKCKLGGGLTIVILFLWMTSFDGLRRLLMTVCKAKLLSRSGVQLLLIFGGIRMMLLFNLR